VNIFLDANILVSVLNKEYPLFPYTSRILSLGSTKGFKIFTSPLCLAIAFYFAEKKHGRKLAKTKIGLVAENISISSIDKTIVLQALKNKQISDFEVGLEYYSALKSGCTCIVTEDSEDFFFATTEILTTEQFIKKYLR
jgi:predicted nucleic acid-binding protein